MVDEKKGEKGEDTWMKPLRNKKAKSAADATIPTKYCMIDMSKPLLKPFKPRKWIFVKNYHRRLWYCEVGAALEVFRHLHSPHAPHSP